MLFFRYEQDEIKADSGTGECKGLLDSVTARDHSKDQGIDGWFFKRRILGE
jgi:hypothetical protein